MERVNRLSIKYKEEIEKLKNQKEELKKELSHIDGDEFKKEKKGILDKLNEYLSFENPSRNLLVNLIDKILISEDKTIEIYYKFKVL